MEGKMLNLDLKAVAFHPYTSSVRDRIYVAGYNNDDNIENLQYQLIDLFNAEGIKAYKDNKTVFECELQGQKIFYGFYDWSFSIGFSCHSR
jgi:hypothetical protein